MDQLTFQQAISRLSGNHSRSIPRALRNGVGHRHLWSVCSRAAGATPAKGVFQEALRDAMIVYADLALPFGLTQPLET